MISIYFSHAGELSVADIHAPESVQSGTLKDILHQLELRHPEIIRQVIDLEHQQLGSATLVFKHVEVEDGRILEGKQTLPVRSLDEYITEADETLLIAVFHPERILSFFLETLTTTEQRFQLAGANQKYRAFISSREDMQSSQPLFVERGPEPLYAFTNGRLISELTTPGLIDIANGKYLPAALKNAIAHLWEIEVDFRLRLFQEEALVHIATQLARAQNTTSQPLLLSIPTGGGKTEAFLIPLIAHLYNQREQMLLAQRVPEAKVRSIVIYPTRALANDQARRMAEILYQMNHAAIEDRKISVGVLTGDTPSSNYNLPTEKSLLQLCPRCSAVLTQFVEKNTQATDQTLTIARCSCGAEIDYFRLTRRDILNHPPDILITSPDMINRMLQSPRYHSRIFSSAIDLVVFDEIHLYESIFGCNVAHLLRRFEEACNKKPVYVGVSATIRNAKELACMIFDADTAEVRYLRPRRQDEEETEERRPYLNYDAAPTRYRYHYAIAPARSAKGKEVKVITSVLNVADVLGHLIRDPHFRKTLIFSNFRQDTDDLVRYLRDQEDRYYSTYQNLIPKIFGAKNASAPNVSFTEIELGVIAAIDRWYQRAQELGALHEANLEIGWHRGGLERDERIKSVNRFASTRRFVSSPEDPVELPIDVMVATSTLEVGIDIGDVTTVINNTSPFTTNEYTQRVGRGGRRKDSLALTVVDSHNPLDFYFLKNFERYANPTSDDFEDAPIIVSNEEVMKSHVYARLLDRLATYLAETDVEEIKAIHLRDTSFSLLGNNNTFGDHWQSISQTLFQAAFPAERIQQLQEWVRREAQLIPDIRATEISRDQIFAWWDKKFEQLHQHICSKEKTIQETDDLSGMGSKDRDLVPDLRSSGPSVGLYLIREGKDDEQRDVLSRKQAISSRPLGGYASQGSVTFKVEAIKEEDYDAEESIKRIFMTPLEGQKAVQYFHHMFGDENNESPFPLDPLSVIMKVQFRTPKDLSVKYNPYRFYCPRCNATYSNKPAGNDRCRNCQAELRQLTEVYMCGNCGDMYIPPVPKVCINPECIGSTKSRKDQSPFFPDGYKKVGSYDQHNDYFRFRALPMLTWQCQHCKTEINYHAYYQLDPSITKQLESTSGFGMDTPAKVAKNFLHRPESWFGKNYEKEGFQPARFTCKKCKDAGLYKRIHAKNIPSFRSVVHEYLIQKRELAPDLPHALADLSFKQVNAISLAREYYRRFYAHSRNDVEIDLKAIFPNSNSYLANTYDTHAVYFRFHDLLEQFLATGTKAQACRLGTGCHCKMQNQLTTKPTAEEEGETTRPTPALLSWEKGRKPDPRRKWCAVVQTPQPDRRCPGSDCICTDCSFFDPKRHQRYLILHTLEHAIITTMPKYTGINRNQVRGLIYPNDEQEYDLVLLDSTEGGSGSFYLLRKNWEAIWKMTGEILEAAQGEGSQLILPYTCSRYNRDLCPELAYAFYQFVQQQQG